LSDETALVVKYKGGFFCGSSRFCRIAVNAIKRAMILMTMHDVEFFYTDMVLMSPDCGA